MQEVLQGQENLSTTATSKLDYRRNKKYEKMSKVMRTNLSRICVCLISPMPVLLARNWQ
jgi:hypothetical protein